MPLDPQVEALLRQVEGPVGELQLHFHRRVLAHEFAHQGRDVAAPETQRGINSQQALGRGGRAPELVLQLVNVTEDLAGMRQVDLALGRQAHATCGSVHQGDAQAGFHLGQVTADCR